LNIADKSNAVRHYITRPFMKKLGLTHLIFGLLLSSVSHLQAAAQLRLSDGTTTVVITDGDAQDSASASGVVSYVGAVGPNWNVAVTGSTKPAFGSAAAPLLDVSLTATSQGGGFLTAELTDEGFTTASTITPDVIGRMFGTSGSISEVIWSDSGNGAFAKTMQVASVGPLTPDGTGTVSGSGGGGFTGAVTPYSLTEMVTLTNNAAGGASIDAAAPSTQTQCPCTLTFNSPASITNCAGDAIPDVTASQDCGSGPSSVAVNSVSAVTNGTCPRIITRTVSAKDGCGMAHTFVQTITVNCLPNCTITPSVTTTIVGTSNLTASVANAGVGATYVWNVLNGTITAGQGTPTITWTAGTDTSSPISICIKITAGTGCESDCSASVKLSPIPPKFSLGGGDTATIGFWHNKNGQALILSAPNSPALGNWLSSTFPCMYGSLAGKNNAAIAALFLTDFNVTGAKAYAQVLAGAFACYFTSSTLAGNGAAQYGFNVTPGGTGAKTFNVGSLGTTIGLQNNTSYTVLQILQAANASANCSNGTFNSTVFNALNTIFDGINQTGDIS
jgi:hypothetical protein